MLPDYRYLYMTVIKIYDKYCVSKKLLSIFEETKQFYSHITDKNFKNSIIEISYIYIYINNSKIQNNFKIIKCLDRAIISIQ